MHSIRSHPSHPSRSAHLFVPSRLPCPSVRSWLLAIRGLSIRHHGSWLGGMGCEEVVDGCDGKVDESESEESDWKEQW